MSNSRWPIIPVLMLIIAVNCLVAVSMAVPGALGNWKWGLFAAIGMICAGIILFRREVGGLERELEIKEQELSKREARFKEEKEAFDKNQEEIEQVLEERKAALHKRQQELSERLISYHEWMEFPKAVEDSQREPEENTELFGKDQEVLKLLEAESQRLFEKIVGNKYKENGEFQRKWFADDVIHLLESIAKIYNPKSERPLLETSVEQLLRATNRISLQLLILLEQLPLNIKEYNLRATYEYIQKGASAYNTYKAAAPYLSFVKPAYYLGRMALGSNPVTLGLGWAVGELLKVGGKKLGAQLANQYAMGLLHDVIAIVGNESAGVFGGDYRHRDANWCYGAELTELVHLFPVSRDTLLHALNEVGLLKLRSEYDRIFLYRCLAAHKSARPEQFDSGAFLSGEEKKTIAGRLERFFERYTHGREGTVVSKWKRGVEERLSVKLTLDFTRKALSDNEQIESGLRSLASFLIEYKGISPDALKPQLRNSSLYRALEEEQRATLLEAYQDEPPMLFDYPELEPSSRWLEDYVDDVVQLMVELTPRSLRSEAAIEGVVEYFRFDEKEFTKKRDSSYLEWFSQQLSKDAPSLKLSAEVVRFLFFSLEQDESVRFVYENLTIQAESIKDKTLHKKLGILSREKLLLIGTDKRLCLFAMDTKASELEHLLRLLWSWKPGEGDDISAKCLENRFVNDCQLTGGKWHMRTPMDTKTFSVRLSGQTMRRYESYFAPLLKFVP